MFEEGENAGRAPAPPVSLIHWVKHRAETRPDQVYAQEVDGGVLTYGQTLEEARLWASRYGALGVRRGDHVVTMQYNGLESLSGWLGLAWLGAVEAPVNNDYRGPLLQHALNLTRAPVMLLLKRFLPRVLEIAAGLESLRQVIVIDGEDEAHPHLRILGRHSFLAGASASPDLVDPKPWDIMAVLFTSGTTGPSKAVRLPWAQLDAMAHGTFRLEDFGEDEVIYNPGPTYHVGAKVFPYMAAVSGGRHLMRPFISRTAAPEEYLRYGVTVGSVVHAWLEEPPRADDADRPLRFVLAPYRDPRAEAFTSRFGCRRSGCFNMTEISSPIRFQDWDAVIHDGQGRMSCGVLRPGYEARIVDEHDQPVPDGEAGELILRAERPWVLNAGYLNNPEATAEAWRNGWFHTGDAFLRDPDGNCFFLDRLKDCIRRRGENISSFEVESYVEAHPAVARCAAVAARKSMAPGSDEEIHVFLQLHPEEGLQAADLIRWLTPSMPRFMIPRYVDFVEELPLTPTQKVRKAALREIGVTPATFDREAAGIALER